MSCKNTSRNHLQAFHLTCSSGEAFKCVHLQLEVLPAAQSRPDLVFLSPGGQGGDNPLTLTLTLTRANGSESLGSARTSETGSNSPCFCLWNAGNGLQGCLPD